MVAKGESGIEFIAAGYELLTEFKEGDVIAYMGSAYIATQVTTGIPPLDSQGNIQQPWQLLAKGASYDESQFALKAELPDFTVYVTKAELTTSLEAKADSITVTGLLETKVDTTQFEQSLVLKANQSDLDTVNTQLATKANAEDVETKLAAKVDTATMDAQLATKANADDVETKLAAKVDTTTMDAQLATKANADDVDTKLASKVDTTTMDAQLATCLLYTSPSPRDRQKSRMPSSA